MKSPVLLALFVFSAAACTQTPVTPAAPVRTTASSGGLHEDLKAGDFFSVRDCRCEIQNGEGVKPKPARCKPSRQEPKIPVLSYKNGSSVYNNEDAGLFLSMSALGGLKGFTIPYGHGFNNIVLTNKNGPLAPQGTGNYQSYPAKSYHLAKDAISLGFPSRDYDISEQIVDVETWFYSPVSLTRSRVFKNHAKVAGHSDYAVGLTLDQTTLRKDSGNEYIVESVTRLEGADVFSSADAAILKDTGLFLAMSIDDKPKTKIYKVSCVLTRN